MRVRCLPSRADARKQDLDTHVQRGFACRLPQRAPSPEADDSTQPVPPSRLEPTRTPSVSASPSASQPTGKPIDEPLEVWLDRRDPKLGGIAVQLVAAGLDDAATLLAMSPSEWDELITVADIKLTPLQAILLRSRVRSLLREH